MTEHDGTLITEPNTMQLPVMTPERLQLTLPRMPQVPTPVVQCYDDPEFWRVANELGMPELRTPSERAREAARWGLGELR